LAILWRQFRSPITMILVSATLLAAALGDAIDSALILGIVFLGGLLGFSQERTASRATAQLLAAVRVNVDVRRSGVVVTVPTSTVVSGDVVLLRTGDLVPADCRLLECEELLVNEASLTGESFPVEKRPGVLPATATLAERSNCLHLGTHVVRGRGVAVAVETGSATAYGRIAADLEREAAPTAFEIGLVGIGRMLLIVMMTIVSVIVIANLVIGRPLLESLLFAVAIAVGITPQMLPAVVSTSLAVGARRMARAKVIVKQLNAIEEFGGIDVLCTDKTGTLTEGAVRLAAALDAEGQTSADVLRAAFLNASFQTEYANPIDDAIRSAEGVDVGDAVRIDEAPYDFERRRLSVLYREHGESHMVTKGAVDAVLAVCTQVESAGSLPRPVGPRAAVIRERFADLTAQGFRVLGVARKDGLPGVVIESADENDMTFIGFLLITDPPKPGVRETIEAFAQQGISVRLLTGDNRYAARHIAAEVGLRAEPLLTGEDLGRLTEDDLTQRAAETDVFAEIDPAQKVRVVRALRQAGHDVGYLGDGINDAPALHAADVGISVDTAVNVAKEAASVVLTEKDLNVLLEGVRLGRRTFANTLKYIDVTISANFGNMVSMAIATMFLPYLPLLPFQILLLNFLSDLPSMAIAGDNVDRAQLSRPGVWNVGSVRQFMIVFGLVSTAFDLLTFGVLRLGFRADEALFRSGWFVVSVATEIAVMLVLRTRGPFYRSRPGAALLATSALVGVVAIGLPHSGLSNAFGMTSLSAPLLLALAIVVAGYIVTTELAKTWFYRGAPH
jgi:Mg2+-importing ATPase